MLTTDFIIWTKRWGTIQEETKILQKMYDHDIFPDFIHQILFFWSCFKDKILIKLKTTKEIAEMILVKHSSLKTYPDVYTVLIFYLMLPITVATAKR